MKEYKMSHSGSDIPYLDISSSSAPQIFQSSADPISEQETSSFLAFPPLVIREPFFEQEGDR